MKYLIGILLASISAPTLAGNMSPCPQAMPQATEKALAPVLDALAVVMKSGDWFDDRYESALEKLYKAKGSAAAEARVALMDYYTGEHSGEELVCAVATDGEKAKALLELYSRCDIEPSKSPVPRNRKLPLRGYALSLITEGHVEESCTFE